MSGSDYLDVDKQVVFEIGETRKQVRIPVIDDRVFERTEQFIVNVQPMSNYSVSDEATVIIKDNDCKYSKHK